MSRTILVVDDNQDVREGIADYLSLLGWDVATARDGEEALERMRELDERLCLVLLDLSMPVMDGPTFRQHQLADERLAKVPVCIVSGDENLSEKARSMGAAGFLPKPFDFKRLANIVEQAATLQA